MGYDLHITTRQSWWMRDVPSSISFTMWTEYARRDPDMHVDGSYASRENGSVKKQDLWCWVPGPHVPFLFSRGDIVVKNPNVETRRKMYEVALVFGARVQGDEGEFYDSQGAAEGEPSSA